MARVGKRTVVRLLLEGISEHVASLSSNLPHVGLEKRPGYKPPLKLESGEHVEL